MKKGLNLGCGTNPSKSTKNISFINIDIIKLDEVDLVHDLNKFPYPFSDDSIDLIIMNDVLEHLNDPIEVLQECYRILKRNGVCVIKVVYWNHHLSYSDPQHKHAFSEKYFDFFIGKRRLYYMKNHFSRLEIDYIFDKKAIKKFGCDKEKLIEESYYYCNIIQGMEVKLIK